MDHSHATSHHPHDGHHHGVGTPHPADITPWSLLRMTFAARLGATIAICAGLWAMVIVAMR